MNAVVKTDSEQVKAIIAALPLEVAIDPHVVAGELLDASAFADDAAGQTSRAVINSMDTYSKGGDLLKLTSKAGKRLDELRKDRKRPYDDASKQISDLYTSVVKRLDTSKTGLTAKLSAFERAERERRETEERAERKRIEEQALAAAAAAQTLGDTEGAHRVIDEASAHIENREPVKVTATGDFGATISTTKYVSGEVVNIAEFLKWLLTTAPANELQNFVEFKKSELNRTAKIFEAAGKEIPGLKIIVDHKPIAR